MKTTMTFTQGEKMEQKEKIILLLEEINYKHMTAQYIAEEIVALPCSECEKLRSELDSVNKDHAILLSSYCNAELQLSIAEKALKNVSTYNRSIRDDGTFAPLHIVLHAIRELAREAIAEMAKVKA